MGGWVDEVMDRWIDRHKQIYYKELTHDYGGWEVPRSAVGKLETQENWRAVSSLSPKDWEPGKPMVLVPAWKLAGSRPKKSQCFRLEKTNVSAQAVKQAEFPPIQRRVELFLFRPSADWTRATHMRRVICFTQSTRSDVNLIQKHPHRHTLNNVWPNIWVPHGSVKLTRTINCHTKLTSHKLSSPEVSK